MKKAFLSLLLFAGSMAIKAAGADGMAARAAEVAEVQECPVCLEEKGALEMWTLPKRESRCGHRICKACIIPSTENMLCPMCREVLSEEDLPPIIEEPVDLLQFKDAFWEGSLEFYKKGLQTVQGFNKYSRASEVQFLILSLNPIKRLPVGAFEAYKNLEELRMDFVPLRRIKKDAFKGLNKLKNLSLSGLDLGRENNPLIITPETVEPLVNSLRRLDLFENGLKTLPAWVYSLRNLRELGLDDNELRLTEDTFKPFSQLKVLNLDGNGLKDLPEKIFKGLNLRDVFLAENSFTKVPIALSALNDLRNLDLSGNALVLEENSFKHFTELENLVLSSSVANSIPSGMLDNCFILQSLDLSSNGLEDLPVGLLKNLPRLTFLDLSGNNFSPEERKRIKEEIENPACMVFFAPKERIIGIRDLKLIEGDVDAGTDIWVDPYGFRCRIDEEGHLHWLDLPINQNEGLIVD